jgi:hypothetical protein
LVVDTDLLVNWVVSFAWSCPTRMDAASSSTNSPSHSICAGERTLFNSSHATIQNRTGFRAVSSARFALAVVDQDFRRSFDLIGGHRLSRHEVGRGQPLHL